MDLNRRKKKRGLWFAKFGSPWARLNCSLVRPSSSVGALNRNVQETHGKLLTIHSQSCHSKDSRVQLINFSFKSLPDSPKYADFSVLPPVCKNRACSSKSSLLKLLIQLIWCPLNSGVLIKTDGRKSSSFSILFNMLFKYILKKKKAKNNSAKLNAGILRNSQTSNTSRLLLLLAVLQDKQHQCEPILISGPAAGALP